MDRIEAISRYRRPGVDSTTLHTRALDRLGTSCILSEFHHGTATPSLASLSSEEGKDDSFEDVLRLKRRAVRYREPAVSLSAFIAGESVSPHASDSYSFRES